MQVLEQKKLRVPWVASPSATMRASPLLFSRAACRETVPGLDSVQRIALACSQLRRPRPADLVRVRATAEQCGSGDG